jgi:ribosomal protein S18 acetylase RimI-like enzyme
MQVREAQIEDAGAIAEVWVRSWQQAYRGQLPQAGLDALSITEMESNQSRWLAEARSWVYLAVESGKVFGFATLEKTAEVDRDGPAGQLYGMYVHPDSWRRGVGRLLWQRAVTEAVASQWAWLYLSVLATNQRARFFYEAMGCLPDPDSAKERQIMETSVETLQYWLSLKSQTHDDGHRAGQA